MSRLHRVDVPASSTPPTAARCPADCWYWAGVLHPVGKIAISETVPYRIPPLASG